MKNIFLICCLIISGSVNAQDWACGIQMSSVGNSTPESNCVNSSATYTTKYRKTRHWIPDLNNNTPTKTVKINFIVCQDASGNGLVQESPAAIAGFYRLADSMTAYLSNSYPKGYPSTCELSYTNPIVDSKVRVELQGVYYVNDDIMYNHSGGAGTYSVNWAHANIPDSEEALNIFFVKVDAFPGFWGYYGNVSTNNGVHSAIFSEGPNNLWQITQPDRRGHMVHEFCHGLGLNHIYDNSWGEPRVISDPDFLGDVWGGCSEPSMSDPTNPCFTGANPPLICQEIPGQVCDLYANCFFNNYTGANPLMSGKNPARYISPAQMGRFHRALSMYDNVYNNLSNKPMVNYVKEKYSYALPYEITSNETWDFAIKMYQDIVVKSGNTLELTCEVRMPINGRIIVEQGAKLFVNGGTITCAHEGEQWQGIEVWGNSSANQHPNNQGYVVIENDALIEHANVAVTLWKPNHWSQTGGVIKAKGSTFSNNRKSVEFVNYQNYLGTSNYIVQNHSYFEDVEFIWNDDFRADDPLNHITMYKVHGVRISGCDFLDDRADPTSQWLTYTNAAHCGILSIDANYKVIPLGTDKSTFTNLDFGVYAMNASTDKSIRVDGAILTNNLNGVHLVSVNNPEVNRNTFEFSSDENNFEPVSANQIGVHAINSVGIQIEENVFSNDQLVPASNDLYGAVSSDLGENAEQVRFNTFERLQVGNYAQGLNRSFPTGPFLAGTFGLQFLCNTNSSNRYDHIVKATLFTNSTWPGHMNSSYGIAKSIGSNSVTSKNTFTQINGTFDEDFLNESVNNIDYYWTLGQSAEQPVEVESALATFSSIDITDPSECISSFANGNTGGVADPYISSGMVINLGSDFNDAAQELQNKSVIYEGLIDGGDTQGLLQTISTMTANNSSQIRQNLVALSPYLTEPVITAVLDYPSSVYPHTWQYDLVIDNIDVVKQYGFINYLSTKTDPLPGWMIQNIESYAATAAPTQRQIKESELSELGSNKSVAANAIIQYYKQDSILILDSVRAWITKKDEQLSEVRLIDTYLEEENYTAALQEVNTLNANLNLYPTYLQPELADIVSFKTFLINTMVTRGAIASLEPTDLNFLRNMADNGAGHASYQARSLLCFFYGECVERGVELIVQPKSKAIDELKPEALKADIKLYPNPAHQYVAVELPILKENSTIQVYSISGKLVHESNVNKPIFIWNTANFDNGTYIIKISNIDFDTFTKKVVIQH